MSRGPTSLKAGWLGLLNLRCSTFTFISNPPHRSPYHLYVKLSPITFMFKIIQIRAHIKELALQSLHTGLQVTELLALARSRPPERQVRSLVAAAPQTLQHGTGALIRDNEVIVIIFNTIEIHIIQVTDSYTLVDELINESKHYLPLALWSLPAVQCQRDFSFWSPIHFFPLAKLDINSLPPTLTKGKLLMEHVKKSFDI
ncbi:hypothetical protein BDR04DRAFT_1117648 [Suillus decipiens]|nr:hypothetical protein BDR04DRAFT_1117648 [Suillus decipiens]